MTLRAWLSIGLVVSSGFLVGAEGCSPPVCSDLTQTRMFMVDADTKDLYSVHTMLNPDRARLLFVAHVPENAVAGHIAATPDARTVYLVDPLLDKLFRYDVLLLTWTDLGDISGLGAGGTGITQAVIDRAGTTLYVGQSEVGIFSIDLTAPGPPVAVLEALIPGTRGGDLAFGIDGALYQANRDGANDTGTITRVTLTGNPLAPVITPVGSGDLGLEPSGLAAYPFLDGSEVYSQFLFSSVGRTPATSNRGGLAVINPGVGPGEPPVVSLLGFFLDGSPFSHHEGDLTVATCF